MKTILKQAIFTGLLLLSANLFSSVSAFFGYSTFNTPENKPYVETYFSVIGKSIKYQKLPSGKYIGTVNISVAFTQGDQIKAFKKVSVSSPEIDDTLKAVNFLHLERFPVDNGKYNLEIEVGDPLVPGKVFKHKEEVEVLYPESEMMISSIQLLEGFNKTEGNTTMLSKNGYEVYPYVSTFLPKNIEFLAFYGEVYNSLSKLGKDEKFVVLYFIENYETGVKLIDYNGFSRQTASPVNVIMGRMDIKGLPTGRYNLVLEARDKNNVPVGFRKIYFERSNPMARLDAKDVESVNIDNTWITAYKNVDTLTDIIRSLRPISGESEKLYADNQIRGANVKWMQQYIYAFWVNRDRLNSKAAFEAYNFEVAKVQKSFGTQIMRGYETDRGRVYLQYGPPDSREEVQNEPSAYPYEIWHYYRLKQQTNKKFIFYNPDLVTNNYVLLHSDARGEIFDSRWNIKLHSRNNASHDLDQEKVDSKFGNRADDLFRNPR